MLATEVTYIVLLASVLLSSALLLLYEQHMYTCSMAQLMHMWTIGHFVENCLELAEVIVAHIQQACR